MKKEMRFVVFVLGALGSLYLSAIDQSSLTVLPLLDVRFRSIDSIVMMPTVEIEYYVDNQKIGCICYTKFPLVRYYVIHSFYIYPAYRNRGHGTRLLAYTCSHLSEMGAQRIYVQPGPFERFDSGIEGSEHGSYGDKLHKLIALYKRVGFSAVGHGTSLIAYILYAILGIHEDPRCLMSKEVSRPCGLIL